MSEKELDSSINNYIEVKSNNIKQLDWDMAIGLQEVDSLKPSKYLKKLSYVVKWLMNRINLLELIW